MLARIQSLYLLIAGLLAVASMFVPFWSFSTDELVFLSISEPSKPQDFFRLRQAMPQVSFLH